MRVISGKYKGSTLNGYNIDGTRATMDRVKESLFASIQGYLKDSICLDLFAGSGSLGIEAISMGAKECYFVDKNKTAIITLKNNLDRLKVDEKYHLINNDYMQALKTFDIKFDIIFLDPPYHLDMMNNAIAKIISYDLLEDGGILVCEYEEGKINCSLELIKQKKYGNKNINIYKK